MQELRIEERNILLRRFFYDDRRLYKLGKASGLKWFDNFDYRFGKDEYAYFAAEEKQEALMKLTNPKELNDEIFVSALNEVGPPKYMWIDRFVGKYYYFNAEEGAFKLENRQDGVRKEVLGALEDTRGRAYYFLKAIIELHDEDKWDKAYGGATWIDILAKIRELKGAYPAPRDIAIVRSYRIYYKTGSRRYPTHTVPEEMIDVVKETLEEWKKKIGG
jgi:hypothetical protein